MTQLLLAWSTVCLALAILLGGGALDGFSSAGEVDRTRALAAIALYWTLGCSGLLIVPRWTRIWRTMLLAASATLLTLAVADVGARMLPPTIGLPPLWGVPSKRYHHLYPVNREMFAGIYEGVPVTVRTNEDGLRTPYSRESFGAHELRVAVLGDSFALGLGVAEESALPLQIEKLLRTRLNSKSIAVLNGAVSSYSPLLESLLLEGVIRSYRPDLVLLILDATDIGDDYRYSSEAEVDASQVRFNRAPPPRRYYGPLIEIGRPILAPLWHAAVYPLDVLRHRLPGPSGSPLSYDYYDFEIQVGGSRESNRFFIYRHPLAATRPYFEATLENVNKASRAATAMGARFLLVVTPRFHHWNTQECPDNWERSLYELSEPYQYEYFRFFAEAQSRVDFPIFDTLPHFQQTQRFPLVFRQDPHWNEAGHAFVAELIVAYLLDTILKDQL